MTFGPETSLGLGDHIYLYDEYDNLIGDLFPPYKKGEKK